MTITVPMWIVVLPLILLWIALWIGIGGYVDRRWLRPYFERQLERIIENRKEES